MIDILFHVLGIIGALLFIVATISIIRVVADYDKFTWISVVIVLIVGLTLSYLFINTYCKKFDVTIQEQNKRIEQLEKAIKE